MATPGSPVNQGNPNPAFQQANQPLQGPPPPDPQAMQDQMPTTQATAATVGQTQQPQVQGPSPWGKILHTLLGTHEDFVQTPNGPMPQQAENKPGQLFRSILAGALLGGATAGEGAYTSTKSNGGYAGAARGGVEGQKMYDDQQRQKQQDAQQQAQKQFENTQAVTREQREQQLMNAQIANMQSETAARQHLSDLQDKEYHDKHNAASTALYGALKDAGGVPPIDGKVPESLSAYQLAQDYAKDPKIRQAPQGYTRHFIDKTDASEVQWDGNKWTHPDGTPADMTDKTSIQVLDVPVDAMKTKRTITGAEINKISGQSIVDPDKNYSLAPIDLINLNKDRLTNENEQARIDIEKKRVAQEARGQQQAAERAKLDAYDAAYKQASLENGELLKTAADPLADPAAKAQAEAQIKSNNDNLRSLYQQIFPQTKLKAGQSAPAPKATDPIQATADTLKGKSPEEVAAALADPKNGVPEAAKPEIWKRLGIKPPAPAAPGLLTNPGGALVNAVQQRMNSGSQPYIP